MNENLFGESLGMVVFNDVNKIKSHANTTVSVLVKSAVHFINTLRTGDADLRF